MKVSLVTSESYLNHPSGWISFHCHHGILMALKKRLGSDFSSYVCSSDDRISLHKGEKISDSIFEGAKVVDPLCGDVIEGDVIISFSSCGQEMLDDAIFSSHKRNPNALVALLWTDCSPILEKNLREKKFYDIPGNQLVNLTHWIRNSVPNQVVTDFCYSPDLEIDPVAYKRFNFGINGFLWSRKNHKFIPYCLQASDRPISVIGCESKSCPEELKSELENGKIVFHGKVFSWEKTYPLMNQSWIHINSSKPRHKTHLSIVRRPTAAPESGSLILMDPDEPTVERFPREFHFSPEFVKGVLDRSTEFRLALLGYQRAWLMENFNAEKRVDGLLEMFASRKFPEFYSFRDRRFQR